MSIKRLTFAAAALAAALWLVPKSELRAQEAPAPGQDQEVLTHGPVHEAFAEPTVANPTAPIVVPKMPAAPIEELPPDVKPDGANVVWIAGYWAWDDTRNDFIWVSGIWRDTPPGYVWVAGYWNQAANGAQWTPGFWSPAQQEQVNYLPEPPQTQEAGPNTPQPSADDFWVPGNYQYVETRYVWRPGYWTVARPDWIWTPAHYVWSPSGFIFIPGHWDYVLTRRGVLFAPVYFAGPVYTRRHFVYAPSVVIDSNLLTVNFFVRPSYCHYYFGDYYGANFVSLGFTPWFSVGVHAGYDPLFTYYRWDHRSDHRWQEGLHEHFTYMNSHPEARPPRTFVQQTTIINNNINIKNSNNRNIAIGAPLNQYVKNNGGNNTKFVNVSNVQREQIAQQAVKSQDFSRERAKFEAAPGGTRGGGVTGGPNFGGQPKTMNLHTMAQSTGGQLPGTTTGSGNGASGRNNTGTGGSGTTGGPVTGKGPITTTGPGTTGPATGRGPITTTGPGPTGPTTGKGPITTTGPGTSGPTTGRGPTTTTGPGTSGPTTGRGPTGPSGSGASDPFRLKSGESIKSGSTGSTGPTGSGTPGKTVDPSKGTSGKTFDPSKGAGPSSGGRTPSTTPSDPRGKGPSGDPRGSKKPDDKSSGNGRFMAVPSDTGGLTKGNGDSPAIRAKDPVRPLTVDPGLKSATSGNTEPKRREALYPPSSSGPTKDPVKPLTIAPRTTPPNPSRATGGGNAPGNKNDTDPRTKDPIKPLKLTPSNP